jgi:hypothetical protein
MENSVNGIHTSRGKMNDSICGKISGIQNKLSASRAEFEEKTIDTLDRHCKGITAVVEQQAQNLCEDFSSEIQAT